MAEKEEGRMAQIQIHRARTMPYIHIRVVAYLVDILDRRKRHATTAILRAAVEHLRAGFLAHVNDQEPHGGDEVATGALTSHTPTRVSQDTQACCLRSPRRPIGVH